MTGAIYDGKVMHRRFKPVRHRFSYRVFSLLLDLDRLDEADQSMRFFSRGRFNLFSFYDRDHGRGVSRALAPYIRQLLKEAGAPAATRIDLLCYPRILGYVFNPIAVYYCYDDGGRLHTILYEVSSTFGERHAYLADASEAGRDGVIRQTADKRLHVSPFIPMEARYHFRLSAPGDTLTLAIRETDAQGALLQAVFAGERRQLNDRALLSAFLRHPLMTVKVIAAIHWEAVRLLAKGMRLLKGAPQPSEAVTVSPRPISRTKRPS